MPNDTTQPTILVKKADGTSVRMTMDELQVYKKSQTTGQNMQSNPPSPKSFGEARQSMQIKPKEKQIPPAPISAPIKPVVPVAPVKQLPETQNLTPNTYNLKPVSTPAPEQEVKLELPKTLHQKSMEEKPKPKPAQQPSSPYNLVPKASFVRPTPPVEEKMFAEKWEDSDNASLLDDSLANEILPAIKKENQYMPATTTPVKDIFVDEAMYSDKQSKQIKQFEKPKDEIKPSTKNVQANFKQSSSPYNLVSNPYPEAKPIIQDIKPPQIVKQSVSPVDELENFSLDDFRRLEINSKAAGLKLIDKFETLKHDSYLLFIDGVKAWYNSPLYKQYQEVLYQSLMRNKSVNEILSVGNVKKDLKLEEFKAILSVNEAIN